MIKSIWKKKQRIITNFVFQNSLTTKNFNNIKFYVLRNIKIKINNKQKIYFFNSNSIGNDLVLCYVNINWAY